MGKTQRKIWRIILPVLLGLLVSGGLFTQPLVQPVAAADDGIVISGGAPPSTRPDITVSPDRTRACVTWGAFDQDPNHTYVRIYNISNNTWSPDLGRSPVDVSRGGDGSTQGNTAQCVIDGAGRTHVVWTTNPGAAIRYTRLEANADPANANNWSPPITITQGGQDGDGQNPDIVAIYSDPNGNVWLVYWSLDLNGVFVRNWVNGTGWSGATKISTEGNAKHPRIGADNAGNVHVIWDQPGQGVDYARRDPATGQWTSPMVIPGTNDAVEQLSIAVDRTGGDVHIVYAAGHGSTDSERAVEYVRKIGATSTNFTTPRDLTGQGNYVVPRIAWSPAGKLTMVVDKRNDPKGVWVNISNDNGQSWSGASQLTSEGMGYSNPQWPAVTMDYAGNSFIVYWAGSDIRFVRIGNTPNPPGSEATPPVLTTTFYDVPAGYWAHDEIDHIYAKGITKGCGTGAWGYPIYCPEKGVTRAEMAVFIERALGNTVPRQTATQTFADVPTTYWAHDFIEAFYQMGITQGCGYNAAGQLLYCPEQGVTRAEMAVFLTKAKTGLRTPPPTATRSFADVPTSHWAYGWIEYFKTLKITEGCGYNEQQQLIYCPGKGVTRAEMAVLLARAYP